MSGTITAESIFADYAAEFMPRVSWWHIIGTHGGWGTHVWSFEEAREKYVVFEQVRPGVWHGDDSSYEFCFLPPGVNPNE